MTNLTNDCFWMSQALRLAERGFYTTRPNPRVGCVIVKDNQLIAEGWHYRAGEAHAEVNALHDAGDKARNATAYVTLEPCSHTGKTGPCANALITAGIARVVYAMQDPNPLVSGRGLQILRDAGIEVTGPVLESSARELNPGFIKRMEKKLPYVRCKLAMSLDGRTAMADGKSQWITSAAARFDVQRLRAQSGAIISGADTVIFDNASFTLRESELHLENAKDIIALPPLRVLLDSRQRVCLDTKFFQVQSPILLVHALSESTKQYPDWVETLSLPSLEKNGEEQKIDLQKLISLLTERHINDVLIESGATLAGSFLSAGLIDELIIYMAPKLMGNLARPLFELPLQELNSAVDLQIVDMRAVGKDWRIIAKILTPP
jgi:diaminohydroxyphosphoribosylaminopyrimidine deaminase / 5-amino-6-(5-phosphoribosylamino)uracil reductase